MVEPAAATILIVEDNADTLFLLKTMLESLVHFCDGRASGAQLFGMLAAKPYLKPDLLLLDLQIPNEDGYTVLHQIRSRPRLQATPVVAITANSRSEDVARCRQAGFDGFLGKPIKPTVFPHQIRRILAGEPVWEAW